MPVKRLHHQRARDNPKRLAQPLDSAIQRVVGRAKVHQQYLVIVIMNGGGEVGAQDRQLARVQLAKEDGKLRVIAAADWHATDKLTFSAGYEYGAAQYDDALAQRRIPSYTSARIGATWQATEQMMLHARIDNLFDEEIATGLSSDGIRTIAAPRSLWVGAEWLF